MTQPSPYWAHSSRNGGDPECRIGWQPLADHLQSVARISRVLAEAARPSDERFASLAYFAGLLHDYGKYSDHFQRMLAGGPGCQHAIHGAMLSFYGRDTGMPPPAFPNLVHVAAAIAGHHAGIPDLNGKDNSLKTRLQQTRYRDEAKTILRRAVSDLPEIEAALCLPMFGMEMASRDERARFDLLTRMLSSCLVDADRLNTAGREPQQSPLLAEDRLAKLLAYTSNLGQRAPESTVKSLRAQILANCLDAASSTGRLFSLSVPTGGGKTLSSMAFALKRASLSPLHLRRIIVVIPYLSIIEQNADVYTQVFGHDAVLEHHSGSLAMLKVVSPSVQQESSFPVEDTSRYVSAEESDEEDDYQRSGLRQETENWDAPIVVTTSVRFFESLFSNRPRDLRRVHNVARSLVILDEVQTLPRRLLNPLLTMIKELADCWGTEFVFATATQPAFERSTSTSAPDGRWDPGTLTEIIQEPRSLQKALRRTEIRWETDRPVLWPELADRAVQVDQCLIIVNLRDHALNLYGEVRRASEEKGHGKDNVFHLSTRMSAAHRLRVLEIVRRRLIAGDRCHVVSTQLIEAGVDVDFPLVLRALAPLDSILQAAGRADREGRRTQTLGRPGGEVVVFLPADNRMPPNDYAEAAGVTLALVKSALQNGESIQTDSTEAVARYFERYYGSGADLGGELSDLRKDARFRTLSDRFEMISSRTRDVFVPDDAEARSAIDELFVIGRLTRDLSLRLRRHSVGLFPWEFAASASILSEVRSELGLWVASDLAYSDEVGLRLGSTPGALIL